MTNVTVLDDADVERLLDPGTAVAAARSALVVYAEGRLVAPPRLRAPIADDLDLVLTVGVLRGGAGGFRAYRAGRPAGDQLVGCWDAAQAAAYPEPYFTDRPLVSAGDVLTGRSPGRRHPDDLTLHCSVGLAGSEVLMAEAILPGGRGASLRSHGG